MLPMYEGLMTLGGPIIDLFLARRVKRGKEDPARLPERRGIAGMARPEGELIWLHAASVGESMAALALISRMLAERQSRHILVTTGTVTSARMMAERLPPRAFHQYIPVDRPAWIDRFLDYWRPDLLLVMESEFWPGQIVGTHAPWHSDRAGERPHVGLVVLALAARILPRARCSRASTWRWPPTRPGRLVYRLRRPESHGRWKPEALRHHRCRWTGTRRRFSTDNAGAGRSGSRQVPMAARTSRS